MIINLELSCGDEVYDLTTCKLIYEKIKDIVKDIDMSDSELNRFTNVYKKLAETISYDYDAIDEDSDYAIENIDKSRNLENGLLKGTCVCAGYANILKSTLEYVGIESKYIIGQTDSDKELLHAWNQIKIDDKWYNTDLTWDREDLINKELPKSFLKSDNDFFSHKALTKNIEKCDQSISNHIIEEKFEIESLNLFEDKEFIENKNTLVINEKLKVNETNIFKIILNNFKDKIDKLQMNIFSKKDLSKPLYKEFELNSKKLEFKKELQEQNSNINNDNKSNTRKNELSEKEFSKKDELER